MIASLHRILRLCEKACRLALYSCAGCDRAYVQRQGCCFKLKKPDISSFQLKMIAIITMLIDHTGAMLFPQHLFLRIIGRIAFPIFAFMIVEGYTHTRNVYKYMGRLAIFAVISEIPYNMLSSFRWIVWSNRNIFFTLLIGLITIHLIHTLKIHFAFRLLIGLSGMVLAELLGTDYGALGVITILLFYMFRTEKARALLFVALLHVFSGLELTARGGYIPIQSFAALSVIFIAFYHGRKGPSLKYAFYLFYPAHITILTLFKYYSRHPLPFRLPF